MNITELAQEILELLKTMASATNQEYDIARNKLIVKSWFFAQAVIDNHQDIEQAKAEQKEKDAQIAEDHQNDLWPYCPEIIAKAIREAE